MVQWMVVNAETHKWPKCGEQVLVEYSATNGTLYHPIRGSRTSQRREEKGHKSQRLGSPGAKECLLDVTGCLSSQTHGSCGFLCKSYRRPSQSTFLNEERRYEHLLLTEKLSTFGFCGNGESIFLKCVALWVDHAIMAGPTPMIIQAAATGLSGN